MEKQQKKRIRRYLAWILAALLVAALAVMPLLASSREQAEGPQASILTGTVARADIASRVQGGGTLTAQDASNVTIPAAVKLTGYLVSNGDIVEAGDPIATVDRVTVMTAITQVQETMEYLAEQLDELGDETAPETVSAGAGGTVKILYAAADDSVQDVMLRHGALAVLSLDGLMAVQIERGTDLSPGDTVCVTFSDGTEVDGRVESNYNDILTVTVEDDGYAVGETVKVTDLDGGRIGTGTLYIHSPWNAVAYSGTVSRVRVKEGQTVSAGQTLFNLEDTGLTAQFHVLSAKHREYEALMLELFKMYNSEQLTAPCGGLVSGVDTEGTFMLAEEGSGWYLSLLANSPNGDDETTYLNYVGQVVSVGTDGIILRMNPQQLQIGDYKDLSGVPLDTALMTEDVIYSAQAPVYTLSGDEWVQISASSIAAGDILLFAGDGSGNFVWVVRVGTAAQPEEPEETEPTEPDQPEQTEPSEPESSEDATEPGTSTQPGQSGQQGGGNFSGFGGGAAQEEEYELYAMDTLTVATVTPQEQMTVQITVDELDITGIYPGQAAAVTIDALPGMTYDAVVTQVSGTGENEGGNSKFTVELALEKQADMLPGMSAAVTITLDTAEDCLCVPVAALEEIGNRTVLYTGYDEETGTLTDPVTVTVGVSDGENAQILSGIEEGTAFWYAYYDTLVISDAPEQKGFSFR